MAMIILSLDDVVLRETRLSKERITIGRAPHNDIIIDNLAISAEHAVIVTTATDAYLEDLNSTNGTQINGQPIRKHYLQDGDLVELARYRIRYVAGEGRSAVGGAGVIRMLNGPAQGKEIPLTKVVTTIGRPGVQVALITRRPEGYGIRHVEGNAYPLVNGEPIAEVERRIENGDVIDLAGALMELSVT
jgi:pSer/pThr/pTyr-binding forkhead associated (FHA) protein